MNVAANQPERKKLPLIQTHHDTVLAVALDGRLLHIEPTKLANGKVRPLYLNDVFGIGKLYVLDDRKPQFARVEDGVVVGFFDKNNAAKATSFSIEREAKGLLALRFGTSYLSANPWGAVRINRERVQAWELFVLRRFPSSTLIS